MRIDVVIPTYNRLWALRRVVKFYLDRDEVQRVIVVDDGSTDGTGKWLRMEAESEPRLLPVRHDWNRGASTSRNTGADAAHASFIFFADDDMLLMPADGLSIMRQEMEAQTADIAAPVHILPESPTTAVLPPIDASFSGLIPPLFHRWTLELRSRRVIAGYVFPPSFPTFLACGMMMMRREVLEKVRYDEGLGSTGYRDETDFQLKALREGFRLLACARPILIDLARERDDGGCHASTTPAGYEWKAWRNNWRILVRHRDVIRNQLGIQAPILCMQVCFVAKHAVNRFARHYLGRLLRSCGLLGKGK